MVKIEEKESALANEVETVTRTFTDTDGNVQAIPEQIPKPICIRFVCLMTELLADRAPKNWRRFDSFLEIFHGFMVYSAEDIDADRNRIDKEGEPYLVGIELFFMHNMIRYLGDFVLQENSPYFDAGQIRTQMGGNYGNPNFSSVLKIIILMISDRTMMDKYPLDELN